MSAADVTPEMVEAEIVEARERVAADGPWANKEYKVIAALAEERDRLRAQLASRPAPVAVEVPELTNEEIRYEWVRLHCGVDGEPDEDSYSSFEEGVKQGFEIGRKLLQSSRILKDGEDQFAFGFVEACAILAAKPFDQPTLAAGIIKEGGYQDDLAGTSSDYPGIEILRRELGIDALRSGEAGERDSRDSRGGEA